MKILILLIISCSLSYAQTNELCDENGNPIVSVLTQLAIPNCLTPENVESAVRRNDQTSICGSCRTQFQKNSDKNIPNLDNKTKKDKFIKTALSEYKKSLTENLVETLKLRALRPTGSNFAKSVASCKMKSADEIAKGCSPEVKTLINQSGILKDLNKQISNELAQIISTQSTFKASSTLLNRPAAPACFIAENDLLLISSRAVEEALSPELMNSLANLDPEDFGEVGHLFLDDTVSEVYEGDVSELITALRSHPLLSKHIESPQQFISFLKTVPTPRTMDGLRGTIYSKTAGDEFDANLAQSCEKSFEVLNKTLCSSDFNNGKFNIDAFSNHRKLFQTDVPSNNDPLASSEKILNDNENLLKYCDQNPEKNKIGLLATTQNINSHLRATYKDLTFDEFKSLKFSTEIDNLNRSVCTNASRPCTQDTFECKVLQKYNDLKNSGSLESKLARSSNTDINNVLRSMIGDTTNLEPKTKEILIANGIIPKDDGTIVAQPDIPERRPEFFAQENSSQNTGPTRANVAQPIPNQNVRAVGRTPASSDESYSNVTSNSVSNNQDNLADFSDILNDSSDDLQRMQDEIRRRLMDLPPEEQRDVAKVKRVVNDSFRKLGRRHTPQEVNAVTNRIVNNDSPIQSNNAQALAPESTTGEATVSNTETQLEKWKNGQRNAALMGMAGAQQVAARNGEAPSSATETPKDLTKIALNITEDPKVKLSDVFFQKLNVNDSETQLLKVLMKNKNNFLLQVNSLNFKIIFNDQNSFNLLLEEGSREDAERIRPQLEIFLRRLRS